MLGVYRMNAIKFLERIAFTTHNSPEFHALLNEQPEKFKAIFISNDNEVLKKHLDATGYLANEVQVVTPY